MLKMIKTLPVFGWILLALMVGLISGYAGHMAKVGYNEVEHAKSEIKKLEQEILAQVEAHGSEPFVKGRIDALSFVVRDKFLISTFIAAEQVPTGGRSADIIFILRSYSSLDNYRRNEDLVMREFKVPYSKIK